MMKTAGISLTAAALLLAACSTSETPPAAAEPGLPKTAAAAPRSAEPAAQTLADFAVYESALAAAKTGNDAAAADFLRRQSQSAMGEAVRNEWLKTLAKRGDWAAFMREYAQLEAAGRSQEVRCYAEAAGTGGGLADELVNETGRLPEGCTRLIENRAAQGRLDSERAWRRVRGLISQNQITDARNLAAALGSPLDSGSGRGAQENLLRDIIGPSGRSSAASAARLSALEDSLTREQAGYAWGVLGYYQAKKQNFDTALAHYRRAMPAQLTDDQIEWYARSALRLQRWDELADVIRAMPAKLQQNPTWQYWLARSLAAQGDMGRAEGLYRQASASGRNFYAVMATEELGGRISTRNNVADAQPEAVKRMAQDGAVSRALTLFQASSGNWNMRRAAQAEWRYAVRHFNEDEKLAAAQLAYERQFYEMAVNTAESTDHKLNYRLRYISPFRDIAVPYAGQAGVDPAWVYGLIRQESRFMLGAQSSVGAQGLMQVMPATAREIAAKIGMDSSELYTMNGNIRMGTWYLGDAKRRLQNNEVMATAGYNAGPGRARNWQAAVPLEGAVYAETIPFNETRDYVKKVMTNATYYASLFNEPQTSLKARMGVVPARR
uniref:lytic transglycosylase domain-containing protein n=1 Tax=Neisseria leonii TaxID=2995413 RepID=UPI003F583E1E